MSACQCELPARGKNSPSDEFATRSRAVCAYIQSVEIMELLICSAIVLCIFFVRDVLLFGSEQSRINQKLAAYSAINLICLLSAMRFWHSLSADQALQLVR